MIVKDGNNYYRQENVDIGICILLVAFVITELEHHPFRILDLIYLILLTLIIVRNLVSLYANIRISGIEMLVYQILIILSIVILPRFKVLQHPL